MVRLPRGFHPQAARRGTGTFSWRPGWRGSGAQPIRAVVIGRYTQKISGVPLTGGQAQGTITGFPGGTGSAPAPAPFTLLIELTGLPGGTFTVNWSVKLTGTAGAGDANNFGLALNNVEIVPSVNAGAPGTYPQAPVTVHLNPGDRLEIFTAANAGTAGSTYAGTITNTANPLTLQVGPQGLATTWYPAQVTLSTSTGVLDTSTANVYLGPAVTPATQVGQVFTGNGTAALAIPSMQPGQTIIVQWLNGHPGDTAAMNVIGTMDALSTQ